MPTSYRILKAPSYLHLTLSGEVTVNACFENYRAFSEDEAFYPAIPTLVEIGPEAFWEVDDSMPRQIEAFREIIDEARQSQAYRLATAGGPVDARAFLAMGQSLAGGRAERRMFGAVPAALDWLLHAET